MIIQAICERLGLADADVDDVWSVLRRYGNMSSATILFVLDEMRKKVKHHNTTHSRSHVYAARHTLSICWLLTETNAHCVRVLAAEWCVGPCISVRAWTERRRCAAACM